MSHRTEALLYAADKAEHVDAVVLPALERGAVVITDRYVDSTLAYQGAGRGLDAELERIARWATRDLRPHLTVLLDVAPDHGMARFEGRDRIEAEGDDFHDKVREMFLEPRAGRSLPGARRSSADRRDRHARSGEAVAPLPRPGRAVMTVFDALVGQRQAVETLQRAVSGQGMTHAWLFTGPPGSGRSNAALAFAAALQCEQGGCGECQSCRTALAGSHPDISVTNTETSVHKVDDMRELVMRAALSPSLGRFQVMIIEDADRLTIGENTRTANALLKAIEEPSPRTVWLLCCPTVQDVLPTISSRCRSVVLSTPTDPARWPRSWSNGSASLTSVAAFAARASQGHIGRARALALDETHPQPAQRGRPHPRWPHRAGSLHERCGQPRRHRQGRDRVDHRAGQRQGARRPADDARVRREGALVPHVQGGLPRARPTYRSSARSAATST